MKKKILIGLAVFVVSFTVLLISIFDSTSITYPVSHTPPNPKEVNSPKAVVINYTLPYTGKVLPDSPFWKLKALRDKIWFGITASHIRRAQIALLFADKRLAMAQQLFERGEFDIGLATFTKAEKYLPVAADEEKKARNSGVDTGSFLVQLATATLKHLEISEDLIYLAPENAKPVIIENEKYANNIYKDTEGVLNAKALPVPKNPFDRD